jgi:hypothetical protein
MIGNVSRSASTHCFLRMLLMQSMVKSSTAQNADQHRTGTIHGLKFTGSYSVELPK